MRQSLTRAPRTSFVAELKLPSVQFAMADIGVDLLLLYFKKFSTLLRAQRVFEYVVRFAELLLAKPSRVPYPKGPLHLAELQCSLDFFCQAFPASFVRPQIALT